MRWHWKALPWSLLFYVSVGATAEGGIAPAAPASEDQAATAAGGREEAEKGRADDDEAAPAPAASDAAKADTATDEAATLEAMTVEGQIEDVVGAHEVSIDPMEARLAMPATDGADILKAVANMHVSRKGGTAGDPIFRGLGGSRLPITTNDGLVFPGGAGQMDPPTSYIFPENYDEVRVIKGPQSVTQGPGMVTGAVEYKRKPHYFPKPDMKAHGAVTGGSYRKLNGFASMVTGMRWGYISADVNRNQSHDYRSGNGDKVHSAFKRHHENVAVGFTPDEDTTLELRYAHSNAKADYADSMMDGTKFARDAWGVHAERRNITDWLTKLKADYSHDNTDHVMDNFSRRRLPAGEMFHVMNPDRKADVFKLEGTLELGDTRTRLGVDGQNSKHRSRMAMGMNEDEAQTYRDKKRQNSQKISNWGVFAESTWFVSDTESLVGGFRHDQTRARYYEDQGTGQLMRDMDPHASLKQHYSLNSGFFRYEREWDHWSYFAGFGVAQRAPDYFERQNLQGWDLDPETNNEIDAGVEYNGDKLAGSANVFASYIKNFILIEDAGYDDLAARNVNAHRLGAEAEINYEFLPNWQVGTALSYTYARNTTDRRPLAQTPPFEANSHIGYDDKTYSAMLMMRNVARQGRYAKDQGSVMGLDDGPAPSFNIFSLRGGWQANDNFKLTAGIDNLFDKNYREFINKGAANVMGFNRSNGQQLYEPGRQFWLRIEAKF